MAKKYDDIVGWITRGGKHIPIRKGSERAKAKAEKEFEKGSKITKNANSMDDFRKASDHYRKMYDQIDKHQKRKASERKRQEIKDSIKNKVDDKSAERHKKKARSEYEKALKDKGPLEGGGKHLEKANKHLDEYFKKKGAVKVEEVKKKDELKIDHSFNPEKYGVDPNKKLKSSQKDVVKRDKGVEKFKRKVKSEAELAKQSKSEKEAQKHREKEARANDEIERRVGSGKKGLADEKQIKSIQESLKRKKDRDYKETDTSDARAQLENKEKTPKGKKPLPTSNSLAGHMDKDGKLTPERENVHKKVIDEHFKGKKPAEGQPTLTLFGGGSASGKDSIFGVKDAKKDDHTVVIDPDGIKEKLPHYTEMANASDKTAGFFHEESSALAKRTSLVAYDEGYDTIYNGTGDGSPKSLQKKIDDARAKGYRVEGKYATVDTEEAVRRNRLRYEHAKANGEKPRLVDDDEVRKIHANVTDRALEFAPKFDGFELWDNNGKEGEQKLIAKRGYKGYLQAVKGQEEAFIRFIKKSGNDYLKGNSGKIEFYTINGVVVPIVGK